MELPDDVVMVRGDAISLREAVKNLLNNALKHGGPTVTLCVSGREDGRTCILVRDGGAGIPDELAARMGERFASGSVGKDGAGLGLSIVAAVAASHGASLTFRRPPHGGFEIGLEFPVSAR
jgi:two-component system sensor histidine kinase TctE